MNNSPCLSDYKDRFNTFAQRRIKQVKRRLSLHKRLYKDDADTAHLSIINDCNKIIKMLEMTND